MALVVAEEADVLERLCGRPLPMQARLLALAVEEAKVDELEDCARLADGASAARTRDRDVTRLRAAVPRALAARADLRACGCFASLRMHVSPRDTQLSTTFAFALHSLADVRLLRGDR